MAAGRPSSRDRIIAAANALATEKGANHLSLDAVAQRAGVSKGGLLYHFATKEKLLQAMVGHHLDQLSVWLDEFEAGQTEDSDRTLKAWIELYERETREMKKEPIGFLAALAENPDLVRPARCFGRRALDRILENASNRERSLLAYLALEGLRLAPLLDVDVLTSRERADALAAVRSLTTS